MLLPVRDSIVALPKIPVLGTGPDRLLAEMFRYVRNLRFSRNSGMDPDKLLSERSNFPRPLKLDKPFGICPCKIFPCKYRRFSWTQLLRASGIPPESLFIDKSIAPRLFKVGNSNWHNTFKVVFLKV
jgi:hypothetical protein